MAVRGGVSISPYTPEEDEIVLKNYRSLGARAVGALLNRSKNSVIGRAHRLGIGMSKKEMDELNRIRSKASSRKKIKSVNHLAIKRKGGIAEQKIGIRLKPQPMPEETVTPLNGVGVKIWELESRHCRWVMGDSLEMTFCGHDRKAGASYCSDHFDVSRVTK